MKIRIGEQFRVPASIAVSQPRDFYDLCRGRHDTSVNVSRGIFYYRFSTSSPHHRIPAFLLYSDRLRGVSQKNPWLDVLDADDGYALYHGDNKTPGTDPLSADGNSRIMQVYEQYRDPDLRVLAPPMILFERDKKQRKSYRRFVGYGLPREIRIQSQRSSRWTFTNLAIELVLFSLTSEEEQFDWHWIDQRRDESVTVETALKSAPEAWKRWVRKGDDVLEACRRRVYGATILKPKDQRDAASDADKKMLEKIHKFFSPSTKAYAFEGLASWVASRVLGPKCHRGWVTARVDGGIDFVSRMDLGSGFSKTVVVVLGQAKCIDPNQSVVGIDLARTVARLKRGWIGVVVTTGTFSVRAQKEVLADQYPLVLIDGTRLAHEIREEMVDRGLRLQDILVREKTWYGNNQRSLAPDRIVFGDHWGQEPDLQ